MMFQGECLDVIRQDLDLRCNVSRIDLNPINEWGLVGVERTTKKSGSAMLKLKSVVLLSVLALLLAAWSAVPASADTVKMSLKGPTSVTYTVQFIQNGVVRWQNTSVTLIGGYKLISISGLPSGCQYIANAWINSVGSQSHTWPPKCVSGSTHLGCLQFGYDGEPQPWTGPCP
jgi:hypothetical protein